MGFDKCLHIKFSYLEEYAGLKEVNGLASVLAGKLYGINGEENVDSRVSVSIDDEFYSVSDYFEYSAFLNNPCSNLVLPRFTGEQRVKKRRK